MQVILIILFIIWLIGVDRIGRKHSKETLSSLFGFSPAQTTFKGWVYLALWAVVMFFIIGVLGLAAGY
ncbi:MAG TPA: hypothetical protein PK325_01265 [Cyclobacteriaceae bacterium]|nr:hypothetical protein [Cyclobacteriaceae bacterium]HMV08101.1 hypothetical protein [Cyclobacteriaceae bacterium]HMV88315.1 hypothetical protein [Cyclobacteriaceae bacterium]HMX00742.1 hypothetical protein [Cyclobacteriaceae bacterium]HMX49383.1 hypothetical protein [Cyclobacteriaceae bacterium]